MTLWAAAKVVLFAAWALVLGYMVASLAEVFSPNPPATPMGFGPAVLGLAVGWFICIWIAFKRVAPREYDLSELPDVLDEEKEAHDQR